MSPGKGENKLFCFGFSESLPSGTIWGTPGSNKSLEENQVARCRLCLSLWGGIQKGWDECRDCGSLRRECLVRLSSEKWKN
jgi:hypothetical protein